MDDIEKRALRVLGEQLGINEHDARLTDRFAEDLEADSLDTVELGIGLEEEFEIEIDEEAWAKVTTVGQAIELVRATLQPNVIAADFDKKGCA